MMNCYWPGRSACSANKVLWEAKLVTGRTFMAGEANDRSLTIMSNILSFASV